MRTTLCTVARVPTACRSAGLGESSRGSICAVTTIVRSSPSDSIKWMELSLPTVNGSTAWGNRTVSRTGRTGILRTPGVALPEAFLAGFGTEGRFGIECPRINFPSLDGEDFERLQECHLPSDLSFFLNSRNSSPRTFAHTVRRSGRFPLPYPSHRRHLRSTNAQMAHGLSGPLPAWMRSCSKGISAKGCSRVRAWTAPGVSCLAKTSLHGTPMPSARHALFPISPRLPQPRPEPPSSFLIADSICSHNRSGGSTMGNNWRAASAMVMRSASRARQSLTALEMGIGGDVLARADQLRQAGLERGAAQIVGRLRSSPSLLPGIDAQGIAQLQPRLVQLRLAVADRAIEHGGNLVMLVPLDVVQHKDEAIAGRQDRRRRAPGPSGRWRRPERDRERRSCVRRALRERVP